MDGGAGDPAETRGPAFDSEAPITVEVLADLQAGLLDDDTAAQVRKRVRGDEGLARQLAALNQVRRDLALLNDDAASAPEVSPAVTERVLASLRAADHTETARPGHAARGARLGARGVAATVGVLAAIAAAGVGTAMLLHPAGPTHADQPTAEKLTVAQPSSRFPLSEPELVALLGAPAELGPLADPQRRSSCLAGLGYSATTQVLGGEQLRAGGQSMVVLLVPAGPPKAVKALVVRPNCSSADTGLLADTALNRP